MFCSLFFCLIRQALVHFYPLYKRELCTAREFKRLHNLQLHNTQINNPQINNPQLNNLQINKLQLLKVFPSLSPILLNKHIK